MAEHEILFAQPELLSLAKKVELENWTFIQLVKHFFPNLTDLECENVLWECTGYPNFFQPREGQNNLNALIEQIFKAQVLRDRGQITCARCGSIMLGKFMDMKICTKCEKVYQK